jgi:hypothetical protein
MTKVDFATPCMIMYYLGWLAMQNNILLVNMRATNGSQTREQVPSYSYQHCTAGVPLHW